MEVWSCTFFYESVVMQVTTQVQALSNSNLDAHFFLDKKTPSSS